MSLADLNKLIIIIIIISDKNLFIEGCKLIITFYSLVWIRLSRKVMELKLKII